MVGDYDGDGRFDAAVYRVGENVWYILQSSDNQPRYVRWGAAGDRVSIAAEFLTDPPAHFRPTQMGILFVQRAHRRALPDSAA